MTLLQLLAILTILCGMYTLAGVAEKCISTYERMKEQRRG